MKRALRATSSPRCRRGRGGFVLLGLILALCLGAPAAAAAPVPAAPAPAARVAAPFLWEVHVGAITHYLLGSVHLLPQAAHPLPPGLEAAYAKADTLVFESDLASLDAPEMQKELLAVARSKNLHEEVSPELYARVQARARQYGLPDNICDPYAAWFCAMTLDVFSFQAQGFDAALGLDQHFYARAAADNKTITWFEAPRDHLKLFAGMGAELGREFLTATLDEDSDPDEQPAALFRAWQNGDWSFVESLVTDMQREHPRLYERLLAERNRNWLTALGARLQRPEPQFVIVGAAHLVGPDGLVPALRQRGFDVRPYGATQAVELKGEAPAPVEAAPPTAR
ncbi:TraB/GumN family protein [Solimonas soli]|uniref:TraB/GumN family protein n=1 Tax=Solimonas soli TaxID=413479 RepID=UPI00048146A1|nr:TraB/GumN family protein [Solimonas soli]